MARRETGNTAMRRCGCEKVLILVKTKIVETGTACLFDEAGTLYVYE